MKKQFAKQQGFTLIELMIVVAIIGILAAIALPAYQDYTIRSRLSEAPSLMGNNKLVIEEFAQVNGGLPTAGSTPAGFQTAATGSHIATTTMSWNSWANASAAIIFPLTTDIDNTPGADIVYMNANQETEGNVTWELECSPGISANRCPAR